MKNLNNLKWKKRYNFLKKLLFDESDLDCKGVKFQIIRLKPGVIAKKHYHEYYYEVFYVKEGCGIMTVGRKKYNLKQDDFILLKPKQVHEIENNTKNDLIFFIVQTYRVKKEDKIFV